MADEMVWPLRAVSKDPANLTKLDAEGNVLTSSTDVAAQFVQKAGDTMTGQLLVERDGLTGASGIQLNAYADSGNSVLTLRKTRGTKSAQTPLVNNDYVGRLNFSTIDTNGAARTANLNCQVVGTPTATGVETNFTFAVGRTDGSMVVALTITKDGASVQGGVTATNVTATDAINGNTVTAVGLIKGNSVEAPAGKFTQLNVTSAAYIDGPIIHKSVSGIAHSLEATSPTAASDVTGLNLLVGDGPCDSSVGIRVNNPAPSSGLNAGFLVASTMPVGARNYAYFSDSLAQNYFRGSVGIGRTTPARPLDVGGTTILRGDCDIVGNITSTGTAHSFAAASIPVTAVSGAVAKTGDTMTGNLTMTRSAGSSTVTLNTYSDTVPSVLVFRHTRGTEAAQTPLVNGDQLGSINFVGAGTDAVSRTMAYFRPTVLSAQGDSGYDTRVTIGCANATSAGATAAVIRLSNYAASPSTFEVTASNFSVVASGMVSAYSGRFTTTAVAAGASGVSLIGRVTGSSPTTQSLAGLQALVDGQALVSTGVTCSNTCTSGDAFGLAVTTGSSSGGNTGISIIGGAVKANNFALASQDLNESYFRGHLAVGRTGATTTLDVGGTATVRGELDVVGNIVSTGTAHSFASKSIPSSAVIGSTAGTVAGGLAPGSPGQMIWDENFLYLHTATAWKKIPLSAI